MRLEACPPSCRGPALYCKTQLHAPLLQTALHRSPSASREWSPPVTPERPALTSHPPYHTHLRTPLPTPAARHSARLACPLRRPFHAPHRGPSLLRLLFGVQGGAGGLAPTCQHEAGSALQPPQLRVLSLPGQHGPSFRVCECSGGEGGGDDGGQRRQLTPPPPHSPFDPQELHERRVTLLEGSAVSGSDLVAARAEKAEALLLLADRFTTDPEQEDLGVLFQASSRGRGWRGGRFLRFRGRVPGRACFCVWAAALARTRAGACNPAGSTYACADCCCYPQVWACKAYTKTVPLYVQTVREAAVRQVGARRCCLLPCSACSAR